ncbi:MAG TPA: hypothetical protein VFT39_11935 [Vicinamibacterales bacterium]|nr:hypothetical protein [Vicinamibacterales bacterium]
MRGPAFWQRISQRPDSRLTSHFFGAMFDFGILTPAGADSLIHLSLGAIGALLALGLGFVRVYAAKYAVLSGARSPEPYRIAVLGDDLFLIGLSMLLIALLTLVVSQSLFPDERDFRILGPLPVRRIVIFRAKLAALFLFTGMFVAVLHLALTPLAVLTSVSRYSEHMVVSRLLAWIVASVSASVFSVLAVAAIVGVLSLVVSRTRLHSFTAIVRSVILALLVVALPFVFRLPALGRPMSLHATWLAMLPPAWFVGLQRALLGSPDAWFLQLAEIALTALGAGALVVASAYVLLFRHFEHLLLRPPSISAPWLSRDGDRSRPRTMSVDSAQIARSAAFRAVYRFTSATLRRSELHQAVLLGLSACGVALTSSRLVGAGWLKGVSSENPHAAFLEYLALWTPFALMFIYGLGVRAAIALPMTHRANWIFRLTETDATRSEQMRAVERIVTAYVVGLPLVAGLPVLWSVIGLKQAAIAMLIVAFVGGVFVHAVLLEWRRIPFTCSYMPGKRLIVYTVVPGFAAFVLFAAAGVRLVRAALYATEMAIAIGLVLLVIAAILRRKRVAEWKEAPLMFEDELPDQPLQLGL